MKEAMVTRVDQEALASALPDPGCPLAQPLGLRRRANRAGQPSARHCLRRLRAWRDARARQGVRRDRARRFGLRTRDGKDLLHQNDGEGLHIRFFNYEDDFERLVAREAPSLRLVEKIPALKNPRKHGPIARRALESAVRAWPNLFAEYSHFTLEVVRPMNQPAPTPCAYRECVWL
jgi:hypothetical protein